ncbi:MAG: hypothetical protein HY280_01535 [Nitrospinae bacterium]|nr:hypothetical protein [Nitrospinota bacterium]
MNRFWEWLISPIYKRKLRKLATRVEYLEMAFIGLLEDLSSAEIEARAFNGQRQRRDIFYSIINNCGVDAIIETGTFLGVTTRHMAEKTKLPVYSSENNARFHLVSKKRLSSLENVRLSLSDSRDFLKRLGESAEKPKRPFIYLDAHWKDDLPLREELETISKQWGECVVMIDDFEVPGDEGFGYDDYGWKNTLNNKHFSKIFSSLGFVSFFPRKHSATETGAKRGCVVLTGNAAILETLSRNEHLRRT